MAGPLRGFVIGGRLLAAALALCLARSVIAQPVAAPPAETKPAVAPPSLGPLLPPVSPACISSPFGPRVLAGLPKAGTFHPGIDMPAPAGGAVRAVADGQVIAVRRRGAGGLYVMVRHAGFDALYAHLGSLTPAFAEGKRAVAAGEKLGVVGRTGVSYGAHLYFQMEIKGERVDPAPYLGLQRCG